MRQSLRTQIERLLIFILSTGLIFSLFFICSCGTASESPSYCSQLAQIASTATQLLCEALSTQGIDSSNSHINTLRYCTRVIAGDTIYFLTRINKSGEYIISWVSQQGPGGAMLIDPSHIQVVSK